MIENINAQNVNGQQTLGKKDIMNLGKKQTSTDDEQDVLTFDDEEEVLTFGQKQTSIFGLKKDMTFGKKQISTDDEQEAPVVDEENIPSLDKKTGSDFRQRRTRSSDRRRRKYSFPR